MKERFNLVISYIVNKNFITNLLPGGLSADPSKRIIGPGEKSQTKVLVYESLSAGECSAKTHEFMNQKDIIFVNSHLYKAAIIERD